VSTTITPSAVLAEAFSQRQASQFYTQLNTYQVILEVLPDLQGTVNPSPQL
jgi:HAE1 family hydrophobic/amphiphilic exporter-1